MVGHPFALKGREKVRVVRPGGTVNTLAASLFDRMLILSFEIEIDSSDDPAASLISDCTLKSPAEQAAVKSGYRVEVATHKVGFKALCVNFRC
jgi:hypothetical protein